MPKGFPAITKYLSTNLNSRNFIVWRASFSAIAGVLSGILSTRAFWYDKECHNLKLFSVTEK